MAKRNAIVKKLPTVETLGCVNVICSDKTGTITKNEMTAADVRTSELYQADITGTGYNDIGEVILRKFDSADKTRESIYQVFEAGVVCNNARLQDGELKGQPTEGALLCAAMKHGMFNPGDRYIRLQEYPFSSEHKIMAVKCIQKYDKSKQEIFFVKGAVERVLAKCTKYSQNGVAQPMTQNRVQEYMQDASSSAREGLRVVAMARGDSLQDLMYLGCVGIRDPPRATVQDNILTLLQSGVQVKMVTGDSRDTAVSIAHQVSIEANPSQVVSGEQLDAFGEAELDAAVQHATVFYRVSPKNKLTIVKSLQRTGHIVGMTGDGVNDGVALKKADIGIAMGQNGTDVCKEAADMILTDDDFGTIM